MQQPDPLPRLLVMAPGTLGTGLACRHVEEGHTCPQCSVCVYAAECMHILQGTSASPPHPQRDSYSGEGPCQKPRRGSSNNGGAHSK